MARSAGEHKERPRRHADHGTTHGCHESSGERRVTAHPAAQREQVGPV